MPPASNPSSPAPGQRESAVLPLLGRSSDTAPEAATGPGFPGTSSIGDGRGGRAAARRRARQQEIVASTRRLFDDRGTRSANIDDIARSVGINRAIIYRHFASKEELFALTLADYLLELDQQLSEVDDPAASPRERLVAVAEVFARYCLKYPAFVDCALALLGRPGADLLDEISESALFQLGTLMSGELGRIAEIVRQGSTARPDDESFDPDLLANALYMQTLGVMHLARSGFIVRSPSANGGQWAAWVDHEQIIRLVTTMALSVAFPA